MQRVSAFALAFILGASLCDGLTVATKGSLNASAAVKIHRHRLKVSPILIRPGAGGGPDHVKFAIQIMNFYGANLAKHTTAFDMAMSIRWNDPRVVHLIPKGADQLSMAWNQALQKVWMPGIVLTNRDIEKYEIVSASVTIFRTGEVLRVERAQARIMKKFQLDTYPFDTQHIGVQIASSKYMVNELVLDADNITHFGVAENIFGLYHVEGWEPQVYETADGELRKSRGALDVKVTRMLGKYIDDHLVPSFIVLTISWAVFFFPFVGPFITPRLALSILALLNFTMLMVKSSKELPGSAPFNWNDLLNQQIQTFMFLTITINIVTESLFHQFGQDVLAKRVNMESKCIIPVMSSCNIATVLGSGYFHWMSLYVATFLTKASVVVMIGCYAGYVSSNWKYPEKSSPSSSKHSTPRRASV